MATQVFTSFEGQGKSEFDEISTKAIKFVTTDYCGNDEGYFRINASEFCTLWTNAGEAYCKAVSAFEKAQEAYCVAYNNSGSSSYCGDYCSSGSSSFCSDVNDIRVEGTISLMSSDGCGCAKLNYANFCALYNKVYNSSSFNYCGSSDYCGSSSSYCSEDNIIAYQSPSSSVLPACCPPPWYGGLAIGEASITKSSYGISIGYCARINRYGNNVDNAYSIAIGSHSCVEGDDSIAIGPGAKVQCSAGSNNLSIGSDAYAFGYTTSAFGTGAYNKVSNSISIFAGNGPNGAGPGQYSVRFTQVAGDSLDTTQYIFQHIIHNGCSVYSSESELFTAQGVKISATNFFNLLKSAGGEEYNTSPLGESYTL